MTELRPCPKCGCEDVFVHEVCFVPWANAFVICERCGWATASADRGMPYDSHRQEIAEESAVKAWNDGTGGFYSRYVRNLL